MFQVNISISCLCLPFLTSSSIFLVSSPNQPSVTKSVQEWMPITIWDCCLFVMPFILRKYGKFHKRPSLGKLRHISHTQSILLWWVLGECFRLNPEILGSEPTVYLVPRREFKKHWILNQINLFPSKEIPGLISFRMDWLDLLAVQGTLKSLLQHHSSKASILWRSGHDWATELNWLN